MTPRPFHRQERASIQIPLPEALKDAPPSPVDDGLALDQRSATRPRLRPRAAGSEVASNADRSGPIAIASGPAARIGDCPECRRGAFEYRLWCELAQESCRFEARCRACESSVEVEVDRVDLDPGMHLVGVGSCQGCGSPPVAVSLECSESRQMCEYSVLCRACALQAGD